MTIPMLHTSRLVLRSFQHDDLDAYAAMCGDAEVMRYVGKGLPMSRAEAWRGMATILGHWWLRGFGMWAVVDRQTDQFIGRIGCWQPEGWPGVEIGWAIARSHWHRGLATEGARAALNYAFDELDCPEVIHLIRPENSASIRVAEKLGARVGDRMTIWGGMPWCIRRVVLDSE